MPDFYEHEDDGKIHSRFTELKRCTPGGAERVVLERLGLVPRWVGDDFGKTRHEMLEEESRLTRLVPEVFLYELKKYGLDRNDMILTHVEQEMKIEVFPGVILHGMPDSISAFNYTIFDYKTMVGWAKQYASSMQLPIYAYLCYKLGIPIKQGIYLGEQWSKDHQRILGYDSHRVDLGLGRLKEAEKWLADRAETLVVAMDVVKSKTKNM